MKRLLKILPVLLLIIPLGGCVITDKIGEWFGKEVTEKLIESNIDEDVDLDIDEDGGVEITTDEGTTSYGSKAEIPDNWPGDVPIIDHSEVMSASTYKDTTSETVSYQVMVKSSESYSDSKDYYKIEMPKEGWNELSSIDATGTTMFSYEKGEDSCGVWVAEDDDDVIITITVTREE